MDLEQLDAIDTTDKEQVKALQRWLQTRALLPQGEGEIDGVWGGRTTEGFQKARQQFVDALTKRRDIAEAEREANDPVNKAINMGIETAPYLGGMTAGALVGHYGFGKPYERKNEEQRKSAASLARRTDIDPAEKQAQLGRMNRKRLTRNVGQFAAPALLGGAGYATQNYFAPMFPEELQGTVRMIGTGENAGAVTLGIHQMIDSLRRGNPVSDVDEARIRSDARPKAPSNAIAAAAPQSKPPTLQAGAGPYAGATTPVRLEPPPRPRITPQNRGVLGGPEVQSRLIREEAKKYSVPPSNTPDIPANRETLNAAVRAAGGPSGMSKQEATAFLEKAVHGDKRSEIAKALRVKSGPNFINRLKAKAYALASSRTRLDAVAGPIAAGFLAYSMLPEEAEAGQGEASTGQELARGATAFTAGAGAYEGGRRLMNVLARYAPNAVRATGGGLAMTVPTAVADMYSPDEAELASDRNIAARNLPSWMRGGYVEDAYQMAQVPERNPARVYGNAYRPGGAPQTAQALASQPASAAPAQMSPQDQTAFMRALEDIYAVLSGGQGPDQAAGPYTP